MKNNVGNFDRITTSSSFRDYSAVSMGVDGMSLWRYHIPRSTSNPRNRWSDNILRGNETKVLRLSSSSFVVLTDFEPVA